MNTASLAKSINACAFALALSAGAAWAQGPGGFGPDAAGQGRQRPQAQPGMGPQGMGPQMRGGPGMQGGPMMHRGMERGGQAASQPAAIPGKGNDRIVGQNQPGKGKRLQQLLQTHPQILERLKLQGYQGGNDPKQLKAFLKQNPEIRKNLKQLIRSESGKMERGKGIRQGFANPQRGGFEGPKAMPGQMRHFRGQGQRFMGPMGPMAGQMGPKGRMNRMNRGGMGGRRFMGPMGRMGGRGLGRQFGWQGRGFGMGRHFRGGYPCGPMQQGRMGLGLRGGMGRRGMNPQFAPQARRFGQEGGMRRGMAQQQLEPQRDRLGQGPQQGMMGRGPNQSNMPLWDLFKERIRERQQGGMQNLQQNTPQGRQRPDNAMPQREQRRRGFEGPQRFQDQNAQRPKANI